MQPPGATGRADTGVAAIGTRRVEMRREEIVQLLQHLANPQVRGFGNRRTEVAPEAGQHILVVAVPRRDIVKLGLKVSGEVIFDIALEEV